MTLNIILKASLVWLLMAILAIANGLLRDKLLAPVLGNQTALPLSGLSLSAIVFIIVYLTLPFLGANSTSAYLLIGAQWVCMTLCFEFGFGHYAAGKSWAQLRQVFNILSGDLFLLVLLITFFAPLAAARLRGI